jgi:hypothetical protein
MSEHAQRRRRTGTRGPAVGTDAGRDVLQFATVLGGRLAHGDDALALGTVLASAQRVVSLVEARSIGGDAARYVRERVDLGDALDRAVRFNRMAFTARGIALTSEPAPGVLVTVDELGLDVTISVLCCWAVLRALPGSEVHAGVRAVPGRPSVRFHLGAPAPEDGCIRVARTLADAIGGELSLDEHVGVAQLTLSADSGDD